MSKAKISEVREPSQAEIDAVRMLSAIWRLGDVRELRAFSVPERRGNDFRRPVVSGYFDNVGDMAREAIRLSDLGAEAVYYTPNPVTPDLLARAVNRTKASPKNNTTSDTHITKRCAFLIHRRRARRGEAQDLDDHRRAGGRRVAHADRRGQRQRLARAVPAGSAKRRRDA